MDLINYLANIMGDFGYWSYFFVFLIAAIEAIVITSIFIPGMVIIVFIGFLAAQNDLSITPFIIAVILGTSMGDILSFILGQKKGDWVLKFMHKIFKIDYLGIGRQFFEKHGDKSVLLGRFVTVIRAFIPFTAGVFNMNIRTFLFWNTISATLWATLYMLLGYFSGAAWRVIVSWSSRAGIALLIVLSGLVISYFIKNHLKKEGIDTNKSS